MNTYGLLRVHHAFESVKDAEEYRQQRYAEEFDILELIDLLGEYQGRKGVTTDEIVFITKHLYLESPHHRHVIQKILELAEQHGKIVLFGYGWNRV